MELSKFDMAAVKRTAQNVKTLRRKLKKVNARLAGVIAERDSLEEEINTWEYPIVKKYGYTSEQILNGDTETEEPAWEHTAAQETPVSDFTSYNTDVYTANQAE